MFAALFDLVAKGRDLTDEASVFIGIFARVRGICSAIERCHLANVRIEMRGQLSAVLISAAPRISNGDPSLTVSAPEAQSSSHVIEQAEQFSERKYDQLTAIQYDKFFGSQASAS
jgi:hypothetical protein